MSFLVPQFGISLDITIPAGQAIACYSKAPFDVLQASLPIPGSVASSFNVFASIGREQPQYVSPIFTTGAILRVQAYGADCLYEFGTTPTVREARLQAPIQLTPVALNATGAVSTAGILGGLITSTTAAAVNGTLPTGTVLENSSSFQIGDSIEWSVQNTGPSAFTLVAAAGHTISGAAVVATGTTGNFRTRKTALNVFVTDRIG